MDLRRSKRLKFLEGVDYSANKFISLNHVQLVCDFLFIAEMLVLRLVNKNLKNKVDLLKFYAAQRIRKEIEKFIGKEVLALAELEGGVFSGDFILNFIMGIKDDSINQDLILTLKRDSIPVLDAFVNAAKIGDYIFNIPERFLFVWQTPFKIILVFTDEIEEESTIADWSILLPRNTLTASGKHLVIHNPMDFIQKQFTFYLKEYQIDTIHDSYTYELIDKYYKLGFTCRNLSYKYTVRPYKPDEQLRVSLYKIDGFVVWGKVTTTGDPHWWSVPHLLTQFRHYNPWELVRMIVLLNKVGFRFPPGYANYLKRKNIVFHRDITSNTYTMIE